MNRTPDRLVAVVGGSCSGKTTLEHHLQTEFSSQLAILPFDDMFVGMEALAGQEVDDWESPDLYRWDDYDEHLRDLKAGLPVSFASHSRESVEQGIFRKTLEPQRYVLVTGFLALHDERARSRFDVTAFIDLPEDEIIRRRKARALPESPWDTDEYIDNKLIPGHRRFVLPQRAMTPNHVNGLQPPEVVARNIATIIRGAV